MDRSLTRLDRRDLPLVEQTLLWSMRAWVACQHRPADEVLRQVAAVFADLGAPRCAQYLDGFMWVLRHGAERTLGVDCPCQTAVEPDEQILLRVFALAQRNHGAALAILLDGMVSPRATGVAADTAMRLTTELTRAGRWTRLNPLHKEPAKAPPAGPAHDGETPC